MLIVGVLGTFVGGAACGDDCCALMKDGFVEADVLIVAVVVVTYPVPVAVVMDVAVMLLVERLTLLLVFTAEMVAGEPYA